jgi:hypothetical protein
MIFNLSDERESDLLSTLSKLCMVFFIKFGSKKNEDLEGLGNEIYFMVLDYLIAHKIYCVSDRMENITFYLTEILVKALQIKGDNFKINFKVKSKNVVEDCEVFFDKNQILRLHEI